MDELIMLSAAESGLSKVPSEIKILPLGTVSSRKGTFLVDDRSVEMILKDFRGRKLDLVIDYEHQTLMNVQAPAGGWITELYKGPDAIVAKVEWTPKALEYLKNREYRYLSPVIKVQKDGRVSAIQSVALTNTPAIDGMFAMCKDNTEMKGENEMDLKKLAAILGLPEGATEADVENALKAAVEKAMKGDETVLEGSAIGEVSAAAQKEWSRAYALKDKEGFQSFVSLTPAAVPMGKLPLTDAKQETSEDAVMTEILKNTGISADDYKKYADKEVVL